MGAASPRARAVLATVLNWVTLAYGLFATAVEPVLDHDEVQIAVGAEVVVLALVSLLRSGHRRSLGWGLVVTGVAAPVAMYSTATLYWDDTALFTSEAFWTLGLIPAVIVAAIGALIAALPSRPSQRSPHPPRNDGDERVEGGAAGGPPDLAAPFGGQVP